MLPVTLFACATSTTHLSSPYVLDPGHVEATVAATVHANTVVVDKSLSSATEVYELITEEDPTVTEEMARSMLDTGLAWALFLPGKSTDFVGRIGLTGRILEGVDAGLRISGNQYRLDLKTQLLTSQNERWAVSLTTGAGWQNAIISQEIMKYTLSSFSRKDLEFSLIAGYRRVGIIDLYAGPRLIFSHINVEPTGVETIFDKLPTQLQEYSPENYFQNERLTYIGSTLGTRVGYHVIFVDVECTVLWMQFTP